MLLNVRANREADVWKITKDPRNHIVDIKLGAGGKSLTTHIQRVTGTPAKKALLSDLQLIAHIQLNGCLPKFTLFNLSFSPLPCSIRFCHLDN